ncbi:hypothetical protein [Paraburkholderia sp. 40]|uniref:hypothetical protein n=1 Tax=unclassified Paraburkholderia TaxID=2615204 RepID=UPI003D2067AF
MWVSYAASNDLHADDPLQWALAVDDGAASVDRAALQRIGARIQDVFGHKASPSLG